MYTKSQTTISQILDAAEVQFVLNHYDDITMNAIAEAAGVTKGALYHHFDSKGHLFLAMMERYLAEVQRALQVVVTARGNARQRLQSLTLIYLEMPLPKQQVIQLVRRDVNRFTGERRERLIRAYQRALPEPIEAILADGITQGEVVLPEGFLTDSRLLAWHYVAIVETGLSAYARQRLGKASQMAAYLTAVFFDGVGK